MKEGGTGGGHNIFRGGSIFKVKWISIYCEPVNHSDSEGGGSWGHVHPPPNSHATARCHSHLFPKCSIGVVDLRLTFVTSKLMINIDYFNFRLREVKGSAVCILLVETARLPNFQIPSLVYKARVRLSPGIRKVKDGEHWVTVLSVNQNLGMCQQSFTWKFKNMIVY